MVLGDAVTKLQTFVCFKFQSLIPVQPYSTKHGQITNLDMTFIW